MGCIIGSLAGTVIYELFVLCFCLFCRFDVCALFLCLITGESNSRDDRLNYVLLVNAINTRIYPFCGNLKQIAVITMSTLLRCCL